MVVEEEEEEEEVVVVAEEEIKIITSAVGFTRTNPVSNGSITYQTPASFRPRYILMTRLTGLVMNP